MSVGEYRTTPRRRESTKRRDSDGKGALVAFWRSTRKVIFLSRSHKYFFRRSTNKLDRLSLLSLHNLVYTWKVKAGYYPFVSFRLVCDRKYRSYLQDSARLCSTNVRLGWKDLPGGQTVQLIWKNIYTISVLLTFSFSNTFCCFRGWHLNLLTLVN